MSGGSFASSGLLVGVGGSACGAAAHHQGSYGCLRITAKTREWDGGSATTERRVPRRSLLGGGRLRRGAAGPRGGAGLAKSLLFRYVDVGSLTCCRTWTDRAAIRKTLSAVSDTAAVRGGALSWRQEYEDIRRPPPANRSEGRL